MELRDVAPGLWLWRLEHPDWAPDSGWEPVVTSTCVESGDEVALLDPLAPPEDADDIWERLDARPPSLVIVLKPDHVRDVDLFVRRYGARAFGPHLFFAHDVPETKLEGIDPGSELPGGLVALYDGRGRNETPLWLPEQRALVFADGLTAPGRRAARLGDGLARGAGAPRAARATRPPVRARDRLPRRAGPRPCRVRAGAGPGALGRIARRARGARRRPADRRSPRRLLRRALVRSRSRATLTLRRGRRS